jgi:hypothetical protein
LDINIFAETEIDNEPCLLIVALDITERKKATEDLKKANKALTTSNATLRKSELSLVKSNDTFSKLFDNNLAEYHMQRRS